MYLRFLSKSSCAILPEPFAVLANHTECLPFAFGLSGLFHRFVVYAYESLYLPNLFKLQEVDSLCSYIINLAYFQQNWHTHGRSGKGGCFPLIFGEMWSACFFGWKSIAQYLGIIITIICSLRNHAPLDFSQQCREGFDLHSCLSVSDSFPLPLRFLLLPFFPSFLFPSHTSLRQLLQSWPSANCSLWETRSLY